MLKSIESSRQAVDAVLASVTGRTRILLIDAVTSATGLVMPVAEIAAEVEPDVRMPAGLGR